MLCVDLFAGLGGWTDGFLAEGWDCIGLDIERHVYGSHRYHAQLVLQDVLTIHGSQFRDADMIVASPPCQAYSYMAMPWTTAKTEAAWQRWFRDSGSPFADPFRLNDLFDACFRIHREACAAAGRHIPMVVENVKGAQPWVGRAAWHFGSFYLWGDVPAVMPILSRSQRPVKVAGLAHGKFPPGSLPGGFIENARKNGGGASWFPVSHGQRTHEETYGKNPVRGDGVDGVKQHGSGAAWFDKALDERRRDATTRPTGSGSTARKAASAMIAKIPEDLSRYIARYYARKP